MVLLLVRESQISHVLAKHFDSVRILSSARRAADFFDSADDTQRHFDDVRRFSVYTTEMELVVCNAENPSGWSRIRTQVGDFVRDALHSFSVQERWSRVSPGQVLIKIVE